MAPQISEHCPYRILGLRAVNPSWFSRPGTASALTPSLGIVHAWITSAEVTIVRISLFIGRTVRWSTSSSRISPFSRSLVGFINASNLRAVVRSEYSYSQYHWWPMALIVIRGLFTSSIMYRSRRDGTASTTKISAGTMVQIVSIACASRMYRAVSLLRITDSIAKDTKVITITSNSII